MRERSNEEWLAALRGARREEAVADLRVVLVRGLKAAFAGRGRCELETSVEDLAHEALMKVLDNLDSFRGESRFTTWAQKIAIRVAFTELRRKHWRDVSLQDVLEKGESCFSGLDTVVDSAPTPEETATRRLMLETLGRFIEEELTERQRRALVAVILGGMPLEEVARRMGTTRGALYKLLHDARKKLKKRIEAEGFSIEEVLGVDDER